MRYDAVKDFEPIGLISNAPVAVVARKDFPAKDLKEFIAYVKQHGDTVKQAHGGVGEPGPEVAGRQAEGGMAHEQRV